MNVTLFARDLRQTDTRILLQSFLSQWIPLSLSVLGKYILIYVRYDHRTIYSCNCNYEYIIICSSTPVAYLDLIFFFLV